MTAIISGTASVLSFFLISFFCPDIPQGKNYALYVLCGTAPTSYELSYVISCLSVHQISSSAVKLIKRECGNFVV